MGFNIDDCAKAHFSKGLAQRTSWVHSRVRRRNNRQWSKLRSGTPNAYCTHCRKADHNVSNCWSLNKKGKGQKFNLYIGSFNSNHPSNDNQIHVVESLLGEVLLLEGAPTGEILFSGRCIDVVAWFKCHLSCDPSQRMVFVLLNLCRLSPTWQWTGMLKRRNRWNSHSVAEWKSNNPAPSLVCTQSKKEPYLHQHVSWRRVQDYTWNRLKSQNKPCGKVHQLEPAKCSQNTNCLIMAWLTQPYVSSRIWSTIRNLLHSKTPSADGLLLALSLRETDQTPPLSPLRDGTTAPRARAHRHMWADA